jgi:hypothetical protein
LAPQEIFNKNFSFGNKIFVGEFLKTTPILTSMQLSVANNQNLKDIIDEMNINEDRNFCHQILLSNRATNYTILNKNTEKKSSLNLLSHITKNRLVKFHFQVDMDCFINLAYSYYPDLKITLDGRRVREVFETALGLICIYVPGGKHTVVITPGFSKLRQVLSVFSTASFLLCVGFLLKKGRFIKSK